MTAGKLLARKRPRLIPVYDEVVHDALSREQGDGWWVPLCEVLSQHPELVQRLRSLRDRADIGSDISLLRVLDVSIWTAHQGVFRERRRAEQTPSDFPFSTSAPVRRRIQQRRP